MSTSPARQAFRLALAEIAAKAKTTLPACTGRIDAAVALVLQGDVDLCTDGSALVGSHRDPETVYRVEHGTCACKDAVRAPAEFCKHRLAVGLLRRANELVASSSDAEAVPVAGDHQAPLPEAPASVNVHLTIAGRQVQLTLRDTDETRLLARLQTVLAQYPQTPAQASSSGEGWCALHQVQMQRNEKAGRTWYSHKSAQGWCKGK